MRTSLIVLAVIGWLLGGCAERHVSSTAPYQPVAEKDAYWAPDRVSRSRQEYSPDGGRFPAVMTKRDGYPTDDQANDALQRSRWGDVPIRTLTTKTDRKTVTIPVHAPAESATGVRLFACRPGALSGFTGRVQMYRGPVVVCASDLLGADGRVLARVPLNFYYWRSAWRVQDPSPSYKPAPWAGQEPSPPKSKGWFGDRY